MDVNDGCSLRNVAPPIPWREWDVDLHINYTLPIPSGQLVISNDLRAFFPDDIRCPKPKDHPHAFPASFLNHPGIKETPPVITINNQIGTYAAAILSAEQGRGECFTGNATTHWARHKATGTILAFVYGSLDNDDADVEINVDDYERFERTYSDLWSQHFADFGLVRARTAYELWGADEQKRCRVTNTRPSFDEWAKDHPSIVVQLPQGCTALQVLTHGNYRTPWTDPRTGKVLETYGILTPIVSP